MSGASDRGTTMKRSQDLLFTACLTTILAAAGSAIAIAAEEAALAQDLVKVKAADRVLAARWMQQPDSYVLRVAFDTSRKENRETANATAAVTVESAPAGPAPQPAAPPAYVAGPALERGDRGSFFLGNTIANLRGMDPVFCRTLTLVDGRRVAGEQSAPRPPPLPRPSTVNQPYRTAIRVPSMDVWLLKADGTQILPTTYSCDPKAAYPQTSSALEISYGFAAADVVRAVAAAIRIGSDYYIEKLQPLGPQPAAQ
jgi:hypothetical protein